MNIDIHSIKEIVFKHLAKPLPGYASHHRLVSDEPYLREIQQQYPFLSSIYNIYATPPGYITPIHICPNRSCGLNIPIHYTEDSHTIFYEFIGESQSRYDKERIYHIIESDVKEVFRYTLTEPVIMNTLLPHSVIGGKREARIIMSWSITFDTSYEDLKKEFS